MLDGLLTLLEVASRPDLKLLELAFRELEKRRVVVLKCIGRQRFEARHQLRLGLLEQTKLLGEGLPLVLECRPRLRQQRLRAGIGRRGASTRGEPADNGAECQSDDERCDDHRTDKR